MNFGSFPESKENNQCPLEEVQIQPMWTDALAVTPFLIFSRWRKPESPWRIIISWTRTYRPPCMNNSRIRPVAHDMIIRRNGIFWKGEQKGFATQFKFICCDLSNRWNLFCVYARLIITIKLGRTIFWCSLSSLSRQPISWYTNK